MNMSLDTEKRLKFVSNFVCITFLIQRPLFSDIEENGFKNFIRVLFGFTYQPSQHFIFMFVFL